ncbi:MAG: bifunctional hydroxymethylpyrimidine kinase/phosphomethylpyrimidine kinase [Rhodobacteraceae bacterium]|nr:bifunctional hydroxymethylpyrimidine kinase/phosphomethylpyrimidine kinase [Paracoccaceae bacterium]
MRIQGRVLIIAGSDSGGGAGIQADIKAVSALGAFAATAITALTAQNTMGVHGVHPVPPDFLRQQLEVVQADIGADCFKTGMLHDAEVIRVVADFLDRTAGDTPLVVDPVMVSQTGASLLQSSSVQALVELLLPRATLMTPNLPEAETLLQKEIPDADAMPEAARALQAMTGGAVLLKGGHLPGNDLVDVFADGEELRLYRHQRIDTRHTHGTGCTLASAISAGLAQGMPLERAVSRGRAYLLEAIRQAPGLGQGGGPVNHLHTVDQAAIERLR